MSVIQASNGEEVSDPRYTRYLQWCLQHDIWFNPKLRYPVKFENDVIGVQTLEPLEPLETLVTVPYSSMITNKRIYDTEIAYIVEENPQLFKGSYGEIEKMMTFLIFEQSKGPEGYWYDHLNTYPEDIETLLEWNQEDLDILEDEDLIYDVQLRSRKFRSEYDTWYEVIKNYPQHFKPEYLTWENYSFMRQVIGTRGFELMSQTHALLPGCELFNHQSKVTWVLDFGPINTPPEPLDTPISDKDQDDNLQEKETSIMLSAQKLYKISESAFKSENIEALYQELLGQAKQRDSKAFVKKLKQATGKRPSRRQNELRPEYVAKFAVGTNTRYEAGAQVFLCYNQYSNRQLMTCYGFYLDDNPFSYTWIKFRLRQVLQPEQLESLPSVFSADNFLAYKIIQGQFNIDMLSDLRSLLWRPDRYPVQAFFNPVSVEHESSVIQFAIDIMNLRLNE